MVHRGSMGIWAMCHLPKGTTNNKRWSWRQSRKMSDGGGQGRGNLDLYLLCINTWWSVLTLESWPVSLRVTVIQSWGWWVSMMPLMLPHCLCTDKESLQTHQQHRDEAMQPRINHWRQQFRQANTDFISLAAWAHSVHCLYSVPYFIVQHFSLYGLPC